MVIEPGDVFRCGRHWLACGDLERGDAEALIEAAGVEPSVVYCDPPWTEAALSSFRRVAGMDRLVARGGLSRVLARLVDLCASVGDAWVEMGRERLDELRAAVARRGGEHVVSVPIVYGWSPRPAWLSRFSWGGRERPVVSPPPAGTSSRRAPGLVLAEYRRLLGAEFAVVDPCLGLGTTLRAAELLGARCLGLELAPGRLEKAVERAGLSDAAVKVCELEVTMHAEARIERCRPKN